MQRQRERQQNNDMLTESVVLMPLWPRAINILISNWSRTRKFNQSVKNTSREDRGFSLFSPQSRVDHALRPSNFYALIGENLTGEFMQKIYTASWNLFTLTAEADRVFCQLVVILLSFSTGCIKWNTAAINSLLLFMAGLFIEFLVEKCAACQSWKSDFGWHRSSFFTLLDAGWTVLQAILVLLDSFQGLHLEW